MLGNSLLTAFFCQLSEASTGVLPRTDGGWGDLLGEAYKECVLPMLAQQARNRDLTAAIPAEIQEVLQAAETLNQDRNRLMLSESVHIARLLNQIGIRPVALKGLAYLISGVYRGDSGSRYLHDIDLLVPKSQAAAAFDHLLANGYGENHADYFASIRHHYPGVSRSGMPTLELHTQVALGVCDRILPADALVAGAKPVSMNGVDFLIPSPTHLAVHLILHSQLAHPYEERIFPTLRGFLDLVQLQSYFGQEIDWAEAARLFRSANHFGTLAIYLKTAKERFGFTVADRNVTADQELQRLFVRGKLNFWFYLRWRRHLLLESHPGLRFFDPIYLVWSLFSRRIRLLPGILRNPRLLFEIGRSLVRSDFYRKLFAA